MTPPNEPGYPRLGGSPNGNGPVDREGTQRPAPGSAGGRMPDTTDMPPWQRGARKQPPAHRPPPQPAGHSERRLLDQPPEADPRPAPYVAEAPTSGVRPGPRPEEPQPASAPRDRNRGEVYSSELPDLSDPLGRPAQRRAAPERAPGTSAAPDRPVGAEPRVQVSRRARGPVRASMQVRRIDPWSTLKVSLILSVALFFVWMIAVAFLYLVLGGMGVWSKLNSNVGDLLNNTTGGGGELVSSGTIFGGALLIGLVNIVLLTAMATVGALIYNLTTDLIGGIEVTLADRD
ncbi:DUF3566 domain-containing protein [Mycobacterium sp. SM1]|uniref:DUF3566 domain-containing protein n=1 Tax=Mycobacterium sp. SM1 TaxID=2816243 RepID=UPI001BCE3338|nr:DUF3566 domain-containing protein [Mycobacterium sp. SM1]MBS4728105.1 DUF3566 domain-containing protein [Mycobacterium sp. SM1]